MLTLFGDAPVRGSGFCDRVPRRDFLKIGALSAFGSTMTLADVLRAETASRGSSGHKAVINIFLAGGPPHQDMWDIKSEAPLEIRGEFKAIDTAARGVRIGEVFERTARIMDRCAVIRTVVGARGRHDGEQCLTGWPSDSLSFLGGRPSLGSATSKILGAVDPSVPPFVGLAETCAHIPWGDVGRPGFLGSSYAAFRPDGTGMQNMKLNGLSLERLNDRRALLASFDTMRRDIDATRTMQAMDAFGEQALNVLTSSKLVDALDLSKEDPKIRARYGDGQPYQYQYDGHRTMNEQLLVARRLVEAGARCVTLSYGRWDSHSQNFDLVRDHGGKLDQCFSALVEDLEARGMLDDVTVIAWGEFGRTPRINSNAGRDHWPQVSCAIMAGGGIRGGQAIGETNRLGEVPKDRPVHFQEIMATLYHNLGIDTATTTLNDPAGRPQYLLDTRAPIRELV